MNKRLIGIDIARALAILLVTWKHAMASFGAYALIGGPEHLAHKLLMQLATPIFLILFGAMLELVYRPRFERGLRRDTAMRLWKRAAQCYGYYALAIITFFLVLSTYSAAALPVVFAGFISVPYSHLLAFYTVALALAPGILYLRQRYGLTPLVIIGLAVHLAYPVISALPAAPEMMGRDYLTYMTGFLYGNGVDFIGPSLIHGLSLVSIGMAFGYGLRASMQPADDSRASHRVSLGMGLGALIAIAVLWNWSAPLQSLAGLTDASLRVASHPLYFSVGIFGAIALTWGFIYLYDIRKLTIGRSIQLFGRRSLFAFGIGNILCHIAPQSLLAVLGVWGSVGALFALICLLTMIYDRLEQRGLSAAIFTGLRGLFLRRRRALQPSHL